MQEQVPEVESAQKTPGSLVNYGEVEFRRLLEKLPAGAYMCDPDGLITYYNQRAVELWGRAPKLNDAEDQFCGSFKLFSADGAAICHDQCWMALALTRNEEYNGHEIIIQRPDGSRLTALAHANPIRDESGKLLGAVNVLVDISDRKRAENALREADRRKDQFLAMLAHELRNPLAPIITATEVLRLHAVDDPVLDRQRETIERNAQHLSRLVDDLLEVSRITQDKIELRKQRLELAELVEQAVGSVQPLMDARLHELTVSVPLEPVYLNADPTRLIQVLVNLLRNAAKYTPGGGQVSLIVTREREEAVLHVRDTGVGIEPDLLPHIFGVFVQGDHSLAHTEGGLGIGLTLVKRLVEMHGGTVSARSDGPGQGSEFTVRLPVEPRTADRRLRRAPGPAAATNPGQRVLLVEDNVDAAETLAELLDLWGYQVRVVHDGLMALEVASTYRPEIILLDIGLPEIDGYEVARRLRSLESEGVQAFRRSGVGEEVPDGRRQEAEGSRQEATHPAPQHLNTSTPQHPAPLPARLVALTGYGQAEHRQEAIDAGFDQHLTKPVDPLQLRQLLAALVP
jgi:PAS domain S-box-containing protein